jgi:hypothetical protein
MKKVNFFAITRSNAMHCTDLGSIHAHHSEALTLHPPTAAHAVVVLTLYTSVLYVKLSFKPSAACTVFVSTLLLGNGRKGGRTPQVPHSSRTARYTGTFDADSPEANPPGDWDRSGVVSWAGAGCWFAGSKKNSVVSLDLHMSPQRRGLNNCQCCWRCTSR